MALLTEVLYLLVTPSPRDPLLHDPSHFIPVINAVIKGGTKKDDRILAAIVKSFVVLFDNYVMFYSAQFNLCRRRRGTVGLSSCTAR